MAEAPISGTAPTILLPLLEGLAVQALVEDFEITARDAKRRLGQELDYYRALSIEKHSIEDIFRRFCISLGNRAMLRNVIFGSPSRWDDQLGAYAKVLVGFDPGSVGQNYRGQPARLAADLTTARIHCKASAAPKGRSFAQYAAGVLAGAEHFVRFPDGPAFAQFVSKWRHDPEVMQMLPHYFAALDIPGFGSALAADFLKELGVKELGKPDLWVRRVMEEAGWIDQHASDFTVQRAFWAAWECAGDKYPPVIIDKLMFLVGSGRFEMGGQTYICRSRFAVLQQRLRAER